MEYGQPLGVCVEPGIAGAAMSSQDAAAPLNLVVNWTAEVKK